MIAFIHYVIRNQLIPYDINIWPITLQTPLCLLNNVRSDVSILLSNLEGRWWKKTWLFISQLRSSARYDAKTSHCSLRRLRKGGSRSIAVDWMISVEITCLKIGDFIYIYIYNLCVKMELKNEISWVRLHYYDSKSIFSILAQKTFLICVKRWVWDNGMKRTPPTHNWYCSWSQ